MDFVWLAWTWNAGLNCGSDATVVKSCRFVRLEKFWTSCSKFGDVYTPVDLSCCLQDVGSAAADDFILVFDSHQVFSFGLVCWT